MDEYIGPEIEEENKSAPPGMALPDRAERKALLQELEDALRRDTEKSFPRFASYADKLRALDGQMDKAGIAEKAVSAGVAVLASRALPTAEAVRLAGERGLTLLARAWEEQYEIFAS